MRHRTPVAVAVRHLPGSCRAGAPIHAPRVPPLPSRRDGARRVCTRLVRILRSGPGLSGIHVAPGAYMAGQVRSCQLSAFSYQLLAVGFQLLAVSFWLLALGPRGWPLALSRRGSRPLRVLRHLRVRTAGRRGDIPALANIVFFSVSLCLSGNFTYPICFQRTSFLRKGELIKANQDARANVPSHLCVLRPLCALRVFLCFLSAPLRLGGKSCGSTVASPDELCGDLLGGVRCE